MRHYKKKLAPNYFYDPTQWSFAFDLLSYVCKLI